MAVINMMVGAATSDGAVFAVKVENGPVRVAVANNGNMTNPIFFGPESVDADGFAKVTATGLSSQTSYWWQVEDNGVLDTSITGRFRTHPLVGLPASFTFAVSGDAGLAPDTPGATGTELDPTRISNHDVFETIRKRAHQEGWLFFSHLGDRHYYDLGRENHPEATLENYRRSYDDVLLQPNQAGLYREVAQQYVWDDHDYGPNNSDGTFEHKANAQQAYRERFPHYPLPDPNSEGIYHSWQVGRVLFVASDTRSDRTPNNVPDQGTGLVLSGNPDSKAYTPHDPSLNVSGDLDVRLDITLSDWTPGAITYLFSKYDFATDNRSWALRLGTDNSLQLAHSTNGTGLTTNSATEPLPVNDGDRITLRATLTWDDEGRYIVRFYTGPSIEGPWTKLGGDVGPVSPANPQTFSGTADLVVGGVAGGTSTTAGPGVVHEAQLRSGVNGHIVANPVFHRENTDPFTDSTGRVWSTVGDAQFSGGMSQKTMLGQAQKAWLANLLDTTDAELLVWLLPSQWVLPPSITGDSFNGFASERDELLAMLESTGWLDRMIMIYADRHSTAISSGQTNPWGGFPVMIAASLDATPTVVEGEPYWDVLPNTPGRAQYGTVTITDLGSAIVVRLSSWRDETLLGSYQTAFRISDADPILERTTRLVSGSSVYRFEAKVVTEFQTGENPDGVTIPIESGSVTFDSTADVFATLDLTTAGLRESDLKSLFPRKATDLLAPFGNEIFVRAGVDIGGGNVVWSPLGYFRIDSVEQSGGPDELIRITGSDRMQTLIDSDFIDPQQFEEGRSFSSIVDELVLDIYPKAIIQLHNVGGMMSIERQFIVEKSRYQGLRDIAESLGKVVYWSSVGDLRIEDMPDSDSIVWDIKQGYNGVLVEANRSVTREGMANAIVARGEGSSGEPVRAVVVDNGANSPTRWGGRFGKIPEEYSSPLLTRPIQVVRAARAQLERRLGMPYTVSFGTVINPALRPWHVIRITYKDGNRERHRVETLDIPLVASEKMTGTTIEQTFIRIMEL